MRLLIALFALLLPAACAHPFTRAEEEAMKEALQAQDAARVRVILSDRRLARSPIEVGSRQAQQSAELWFEHAVADKTPCTAARAEVVRVFVEKGVHTPISGIRHGLGCHHVLAEILPLFPPETVSGEAIRFADGFAETLSSLAQNGGAAQAEGMVEIFKILEAHAQANCADSSGITQSCRLRAKTGEAREKTKTAISTLLEREKYERSPEAAMAKICEMYNELRRNKAIIDRERKIGATSGAVDTGKLHDAGARVVDLERQLGEVKDGYKQESGRELDLGQCEKK